MSGISRFNHEGYSDPTAFEALTKVTKNENDLKRYNELMTTLRYIIKNSGFKIINMPELKSLKTGIKYK